MKLKFARVNSIRITKSINLQLFTLILKVLGVRGDVDTFKLTASAQSINRVNVKLNFETDVQ